MCYKIISGEVSLHCNLLDLSDFTQTKGNKYKLYKQSIKCKRLQVFFSVTVFVIRGMHCLILLSKRLL